MYEGCMHRVQARNEEIRFAAFIMGVNKIGICTELLVD